MTNGSKQQTREEAERLMNNFINDHMNKYRCDLAKDNKQSAYKELGMALHPIMDSTAPPHDNFQPWFRSYPLLFLLLHGKREIEPNAYIDTTVNRMINAFGAEGAK